MHANSSRGLFLMTVLQMILCTVSFADELTSDTLKPKIVLELFTSQGCSSCPPADLILEQLANEPNVIALSRPVQYWDKLGWKDTLATRENTDKQFAYASRWRKSGAYTPQLVIDGAEDVVGNQRATIRNRIDAIEQHKSGVVVHESQQADGSIELTLTGDTTTYAEVHLLALRASTLVAIGRGENAARQIRYVNAVVAEKTIGEWSGKTATFTISSDDLRGNKTDRWAIVIQEPGPGRILGADYLHG